MKLALLLLAFLGLADWKRPDWKRIEPGYVPSFPRDHGMHAEFRSEWWYATGIVKDASGARFGVELTLFRQGLSAEPLAEGQSSLRARDAFAAHLAIVDVERQTTILAERARRATPGLARASQNGIDHALEGWTMRLDEQGVLQLAADAREKDAAIELALTPTKPLVMHGERGISRKGDAPGLASAYMSWTRMSARGSLEIAGARRAVEGEFWFDHEWGTTQLGEGVVGWDWFGVRLDDGRELMLYRLRRADGSAHPASSATLVERDGTARYFPLAKLTCEVVGTWTSPRTHASWPVRWRVKLDDARLDLEIVSLVDDCELDTRKSTGVVYWEGPVAVKGTAKGSGYGEFTGYAGSLAGRF